MALRDNLKPTGRKGVFYKEHATRKHGVRRDRLFVIRYTITGRTCCEALGWMSDGVTEIQAEQKIAEFRSNAATGAGPCSIADEQAIRDAELAAIEAERKRDYLNIVVQDFFEQKYLPHAQAEKKRDTWESEERLFRLWILPVIGHMRFADIVPLHLDMIKKHMREGKRKDTSKKSKPRPLSPKTVMHALALVRQVWNFARREGIVSGDWPGRDVKKPKFDNRKNRYFTREEADKLLSALKTKSPQWHDISLLALHAGLRASEIFGLTWDCVDFENETMLLLDTKNSKTRTAYMTPTIKAMLEARKAASINSLVFTRRDGGRITEVSATFPRTIEALGFNDGTDDPRLRLSFHSLRHTFASWMVEAGIPLYTVKELLGHETLQMTVRYSHIGENAMRTATKAFADAFDQPSEGKVLNIASARQG